MADQGVSFSVPQALYDSSIARLRAAGVADPEKLLDAALQASAIDAVETIGGSGPIPTALADMRAARLLELCKLRKEILDDEVVAVLFRVMPTTAGSITRRMQATYEAALETALTAHMVAKARLSSPKKEEDEAPRHRIVFQTSAAFSHAVKKLAASGLLGEVSVEGPKRAIEFPQEVEVGDGNRKTKVKIATETLGIS